MTPEAFPTDEELSEIKARVDASAPGPWVSVASTEPVDFHGFPTRTTVRTAGWPSEGWSKYGFEPSDAEFIAHARTDVPLLLAALRARRDEVDDLAEALRLCMGRALEADLVMDQRRLAEIVEYWRSPTGMASAPPGMVPLAQKDIGELVEEVRTLRAVLDDIYPALASRAMQLQEAGEERAAALWSAICRQVAATWPPGTDGAP